eukprot:jgi/Botrbrau1/16975/Bobra.49_2s0036.2
MLACLSLTWGWLRQSAGFNRNQGGHSVEDSHVMRTRKTLVPQAPLATSHTHPLEMPHKPPGKPTWLPPAAHVLFMDTLQEDGPRDARTLSRLDMWQRLHHAQLSREEQTQLLDQSQCHTSLGFFHDSHSSGDDAQEVHAHHVGHVIHGLSWQSRQACTGALQYAGGLEAPHEGPTHRIPEPGGDIYTWRSLLGDCARQSMMVNFGLPYLPFQAALGPGLRIPRPESAIRPAIEEALGLNHIPSHAPSGTLLHAFIPRILSQVSPVPESNPRGLEAAGRLPVPPPRRSFKHVPLTTLLGARSHVDRPPDRFDLAPYPIAVAGWGTASPPNIEPVPRRRGVRTSVWAADGPSTCHDGSRPSRSQTACGRVHAHARGSWVLPSKPLTSAMLQDVLLTKTVASLLPASSHVPLENQHGHSACLVNSDFLCEGYRSGGTKLGEILSECFTTEKAVATAQPARREKGGKKGGEKQRRRRSRSRSPPAEEGRGNQRPVFAAQFLS